MQISITKQKEEPLLSRTKVYAKLEFENKTPSYKEAVPLLAEAVKKDEKLVAIRHIYNIFGTKNAELTAYVYSDENKKNFIEPKIKEKKEIKK